MRRLAVVLGIILGMGCVPAMAQDAPGITLKASRSKITYLQQVRVSGAISPAAADQPVEIVDQDGRVRARLTTDDQGRFATRLQPKANSTLRAQWVGAPSDAVVVKVRPLVGVRLGRVRLFGHSRVRGTVKPVHEGGRVTVTLRRNGRRFTSRTLRLTDGTSFSGLFGIKKPGSFRAVASFKDDDHLRASDWSTTRSTVLPRLSVGSTGAYVGVLERRLDALGYLLKGVDRTYDVRTSDAVIAFNKVNRRSRLGSVDESTWAALASPKVPQPKFAKPGFHIEVDQTKQVLYFVKKKRVTRIVHVSTGAGAATRDGTFTFHRRLGGTSGGGLYYPTYFDGLRAIHGWPDVPTYNASHGCVRVPMWAAQWIYNRLELGDKINIYH
ncbi:MAG TPA: L,D-transpeptidase family protein [Actinomycetota bacterium]|nr:L,D-transpeptidase family protein [Actinomycetota bacterium]